MTARIDPGGLYERESKVARERAKAEARPVVTPRLRLMSYLLMGAIAAVVFGADQATKSLIEHRISVHDVVPVVPGFFNLINTKNSGAVFGWFSESTAPWKTPLLIAISSVMLLGVLMLVARSQHLHWATAAGLALILGGAVSNLFDRIRYGHVEDFLDLYYRGYHWPAFNVADSAIVVGTVLIVLHVIFSE